MKKATTYIGFLSLWVLLGIVIFSKYRPDTDSPAKETHTIDENSELLSPISMEEWEQMSAETYEPYRQSNLFNAWLKDSVTKEFLMGKVNRKVHPQFIKVDKEHTERDIYLLKPVYEAYIKMHEAARADGVKLLITSGHRTFVEQVCEWELRWNNPRTTEPFANETEKARYLLQYRSMPGTSRHHWGTDIDLNSFKPTYFETREGEKVYEWLSTHAHLYGFFQPYTALDENRPVGYCEEKWHWSYHPIAQPMLNHYLHLVHKEDIAGFKGDKAVRNLNIISEWVCGISKKVKGKG